jgi:hypothetical protein
VSTPPIAVMAFLSDDGEWPSGLDGVMFLGLRSVILGHVVGGCGHVWC